MTTAEIRKAMKEYLESKTGYKTLKAARADERYIKTFLIKGNAKLKDYDPQKDGISDNKIYKFHFNGKSFKYAQFNLPAVSTCPFATDGCKKFCYAKRDERYPSVRENRTNNLNVSMTDDFADRIIYTITVNKMSAKYHNSVMIVRIHESGEFYNPTYLKSWIKVFDYFKSWDIVFQFYTKSFDYFLALNDTEKEVIRNGLSAHHIGASWSIDDTMKPENREKALKLMTMYPNSNIYYATLKEDPKHQKCDCRHCAKCGKCIATDGRITDCIIH